MTLRRVIVPALGFLALAALGGCAASGRTGEGARGAAERASLAPSPRPTMGRIVAIDPELHFAFVEPVSGAPAGALSPGAFLITRSDALVETGRLEASGHRRTRTLGTRILAGSPKPGDEVVWEGPETHAPAPPPRRPGYLSPP